MDELELCPFCSVKPELGYNGLSVDERWDFINCRWFVRCPQCGIKITEFARYRLTRAGTFEVFNDNYDGRAQVVAKWNRRAS